MSTKRGDNNKVLEENVNVIVRCRPMNAREIEANEKHVVECHPDRIEIASKNKTFIVDKVFNSEATQEQIYREVVSPMVYQTLNGYNCTIFAYGQTGTGKTYTIEGYQENHSNIDIKTAHEQVGMLGRAARQIFQFLPQTGHEYTVKVSHFEVYNEVIYDLINPSNTKLKLYDDPNHLKGVHVHGLEESPVKSVEELFKILEKSWENQKRAETERNESSSRSHCIISFLIYIRERRNSSEDLIRIGKLNLVDLAGSENIGKSGTDKNTLRTKESGKINQGLLTLGRVIKSLTEGSMHIPYRESKLTRLLQDSLGGKTKTCIIATISPSSGSLDETLNTLDYGTIARKIVNYPEPNIKIMNREGLKMLMNEIINLKAIIESTQKKEGVPMSKDEHDQFLKDMKLMKAKINDLSEVLHKKQSEILELKESFESKSHILEEKDKELNQKMSVLAVNNKSLNKILEQLNVTQQALNERIMIIQEHLNIESKFKEEAELVLSVLSSAIKDAEGLFNKVDRQNSAEELNVSYLNDFKNEINNHLSCFEDKLNGYFESVLNECGSLLEKLNNYSQLKESYIRNINGSLTNGRVKLLTDDISEIYKTLSNNIKNIVNDVDQLNYNMVSERVELEKEFLEETKNDISQLIHALHNQSDQLKNKISQLDSKILIPHKRLSNHFDEQRKKIEDLQSSLQEYTVNEQARVSQCNNILNDLISSQQSFVEEFKNTANQRLNDLFMNYSQGYINETSNMISSINKDLKSLEKESNELNSLYSESVEKITKEYEEVDQYMMNHVDSLVSSLNIIKDTNVLKEQRFDELLSSLKKEIESLNVDHLHKTNEIKALIHGGRALSVENFEKLQLLLGSYRQSMNEMNSLLYKNNTEHVESISRFKKTISSTISDISNITKGDISTALKYSEDIKENLSNFNLRNYEPTGETPLKKTFEYPTKLTAMRDYSEIINEYRSNKLNL